MRTLNLAVAFACLMCSAESVLAQGGGGAAAAGMGAGIGSIYQSHQNQPRGYNYRWYQAAASETITVDGSAIIAIQPESLRLVFAVTAEGEKSEDCSQKVKVAIAKIREAVQPMNLSGNRVVEDFIAVIPSYNGRWSRLPTMPRRT